MRTRSIVFVLISIALLSDAYGQKQKDRGLLESKRKEFDLNNYYITLNLQNALVLATGVLEWRLDSLVQTEGSSAIRSNLVKLKYNLISVISKTTLHSDPLVGALDSWTLAQQLVNYFSDSSLDALYRSNRNALLISMKRYLAAYEKALSPYVSEQNREQVATFAANNPILDAQLNRRSIVPQLAAWVSSDELRLKSSLLTMTDLMRDLSFRLNFYSEMIPKQARWQIESAMDEILPKDSLAVLIYDSKHLMHKATHTLETMDSLINVNRDTLLSVIDYQRIVSLRFLQQERIAMVNAMGGEREMMVKALQEERQAMQQFASGEREAMTEDMRDIGNEMMGKSIPVGKELIDYIFLRSLLLIGLLGLLTLAGIVIVRKMK